MRPCTIASRELAGSIGYATQWAKIWKKVKCWEATILFFIIELVKNLRGNKVTPFPLWRLCLVLLAMKGCNIFAPLAHYVAILFGNIFSISTLLIRRHELNGVVHFLKHFFVFKSVGLNVPFVSTNNCPCYH